MATALSKLRVGSDTAMSFNLTAKQVESIVQIRDQVGMTTGELVRRACEAISEEQIRQASPEVYDHHVTVLMPKDLKRRIDKLAKGLGLSLSDVVRIACDDYFRERSAQAQQAQQPAATKKRGKN